MPLKSKKSSLIFNSAIALAIASTMAQPASADVKEWKIQTVRGAKAYKELRFGDAERAFKKAIAEAKALGTDNFKLAVSVTNLGVLYNYRGFFDKAEPLFVQAVTIQEKLFGKEDTRVISSVGKLCQFYLKRKDFAKANPLCLRIIKYGDKTLKDKSIAKLNPKLQKTLSKEEKDKLKKQHNQVLELAVLYDRMGTAYLEYPIQKRYQVAEKLFRLSTQLREKVLLGNHLALSRSYENLGKVYLKENRFSKAEPQLKKAYRISKSTLGFTNPKTYSKLDTWSQSLVGLRRYAHAESNYRLALKSFLKDYGSRSGYVANIETALAHVLARRGRYSQAANYLHKAIKIKEHLRGPQHASLAVSRKEYRSMLRKAGRRTASKNDVQG